MGISFLQIFLVREKFDLVCRVFRVLWASIFACVRANAVAPISGVTSQSDRKFIRSLRRYIFSNSFLSRVLADLYLKLGIFKVSNSCSNVDPRSDSSENGDNTANTEVKLRS